MDHCSRVDVSYQLPHNYLVRHIPTIFLSLPLLTKYLVVKKPSVSHRIPQHFFRDTSKVNISLSRQVVDCKTDDHFSMVPFREFWVSFSCYLRETILTWIKFKAHGTWLVSSLTYLSNKSRLTNSRACWSSKPFPRHRLFHGVFCPRKFWLWIGTNVVLKSAVMFIMGGLLKMDTKSTGIGAAAMIFAYQG